MRICPIVPNISNIKPKIISYSSDVRASGATISQILGSDKGIFESISDAKRVISQGGLSVENEIINDPNTKFDDLFKKDETPIVKGKKTPYTIKVEK